MRKITQEEFNNIKPNERGIRVFGSYIDFSDIQHFGERCNFGEECSFGEMCNFEKECSFGKMSSFGEKCNFGGWCSFGKISSFGEKCNFGGWCSFGEGCSFGERCNFEKECSTFGDTCSFGRKCKLNKLIIIDFKSVDGIENNNRKITLWNLGNKLFFQVGCFFITETELRRRVLEKYNTEDCDYIKSIDFLKSIIKR